MNVTECLYPAFSRNFQFHRRDPLLNQGQLPVDKGEKRILYRPHLFFSRKVLKVWQPCNTVIISSSTVIVTRDSFIKSIHYLLKSF